MTTEVVNGFAAFVVSKLGIFGKREQEAMAQETEYRLETLETVLAEFIMQTNR